MSTGPGRIPWFLRVARPYVRSALGRDLAGVRVAGLADARGVAAGSPIILAANHVGFWDSFLVVALDEALGTDGWALMHAENLGGLPFFGWLGAIPLEPGRPLAGLRSGAALLDRPGRALWIFPQGGHRPAHLRPLRLQPGVRLLARMAPAAAVIPVAIQYAWEESHNPAAWVHLGSPLPGREVGARAGGERLEAALVEGLAAIDRTLAGEAEPFPVLVRSRARRPDRGLGARLLARVRRG
jgi:1-acyl-sn-glycerol-3-phosphate acyltransferase